MSPGRAFSRAVRDLRRRGVRSLLLVGGVAVGVAMLVFLLAFVAGTRNALLDRVVSTLPITNVTVVPRSFSLSVLRFDSPFSTLDPRAAERISTIDGVESVLPMAALRMPAQLRTSFFGRGFITDTGVFGVEPDLIADQLGEDAGFSADAAGAIPAVISSDLIEMYNTGFAKANDLPQLTPAILAGQRATLLIGSSSFTGDRERARPVAIRMVGVSDRVPLVGVSVPRPVVERWNRELAGSRQPEFIQLNVVVERAEDVDRVVGSIESMGYTVSTGREVASRIRTLSRVLQLAFGMIGAVVLAVAGLGIANALALAAVERRHEIGVYRSVGATRADIRMLFLAEAVLIGLLGSVAGIGLALVATGLADWGIDRALPDIPFLPSTLFVVSWPIVLGGLSLGLFVSVVAAVSPALQAARLDPARVLRSG